MTRWAEARQGGRALAKFVTSPSKQPDAIVR